MLIRCRLQYLWLPSGNIALLNTYKKIPRIAVYVSKRNCWPRYDLSYSRISGSLRFRRGKIIMATSATRETSHRQEEGHAILASLARPTLFHTNLHLPNRSMASILYMRYGLFWANDTETQNMRYGGRLTSRMVYDEHGFSKKHLTMFTTSGIPCPPLGSTVQQAQILTRQ